MRCVPIVFHCCKSVTCGTYPVMHINMKIATAPYEMMGRKSDRFKWKSQFNLRVGNVDGSLRRLVVDCILKNYHI